MKKKGTETLFQDIDRIETLAERIENLEGEPGVHVRRVCRITEYLMTDTPVGSGVPRDAKEKINLGIKLHDIGKIMMPKAILNKAGKLTPKEYDVIKTHTICGVKLLEKIPGFTSHPARAYVCDIVRHHHERWDGNGYPDGLKGDEISIWVQAMSMADVYDALVSRRIYKEAFPYEKATQMMADGECGKFNPNMLQFFFEAEPNFRKLYVEGP